MLVVFVFIISLTAPIVEALATPLSENHSVLVMNERITTHDVDCLASNIYHEARADSYEEQVLVAQVVINRLHAGTYGTTICQVVHQRSSHGCQFSWYCHERLKPVRELDAYQKSKDIALRVLRGDITNASGGKIVMFHERRVHVSWSKEFVLVKQTRKYCFYSKKEQLNVGPKTRSAPRKPDVLVSENPNPSP